MRLIWPLGMKRPDSPYGGAEGAAGQVKGYGDVVGLVVLDDATSRVERKAWTASAAVAAHEDVNWSFRHSGVDAEEDGQECPSMSRRALFPP